MCESAAFYRFDRIHRCGEATMGRLGVWFLILGVGSFILPMIGLQFRILSILGDKTELVGGIMATVGLVLVIISQLSKPAAEGEPATKE
jgi:hypothetical protein